MITAAGILLSNFPYFMLGMALVWNHLRYGRGHALAVMFGIAALYALFIIMMTHSLPPETLNMIKLPYEIAYMCLVLASFLWVVKFKTTRLLFMAFFVKHIADFTISMVRILTVRLFPEQPYAAFGLHYNIVHLALLCFIFPFTLWFIRKVMQKLIVVESTLWRYLWLVPVVFYALNTLLFVTHIEATYDTAEFIIQTVIIFVISLMVYALIGETLRATLEKILTEENERRLADENIALDRMNSMKSELMTTISHEARTPLAVLSSYASLVSMELKDKGVEMQTASNLDKIAFEAKRVAELIDSMNKLTLSGKHIAKRISLDIGETIKQTAGLYRHLLQADKVTLNLYIEKNLPPVFGSPEELTQVFFNLLQNARKATANGIISISAEPEGGFISVSVSDTGSGIQPGILPRIFERGVSGSGSTGLGLSICKEIVEAHGGEISIDTELNKGTRITFTFPIYERRDTDGEQRNGIIGRGQQRPERR